MLKHLIHAIYNIFTHILIYCNILSHKVELIKRKKITLEQVKNDYNINYSEELIERISCDPSGRNALTSYKKAIIRRILKSVWKQMLLSPTISPPSDFNEVKLINVNFEDYKLIKVNIRLKGQLYTYVINIRKNYAHFETYKDQNFISLNSLLINLLSYVLLQFWNASYYRTEIDRHGFIEQNSLLFNSKENVNDLLLNLNNYFVDRYNWNQNNKNIFKNLDVEYSYFAVGENQYWISLSFVCRDQHIIFRYCKRTKVLVLYNYFSRKVYKITRQIEQIYQEILLKLSYQDFEITSLKL